MSSVPPMTNQSDYLRLEKALAQLRVGDEAELMLTADADGPGAGGIAFLLAAVMAPPAASKGSTRELAITLEFEDGLPSWFPPGVTSVRWRLDYQNDNGDTPVDWQAEGVFYIGVGELPPNAEYVTHTDIPEAVMSNFPQSEQIPFLGPHSVKRGLRRAAETSLEGFGSGGIYGVDHRQLMQNAVRTIVDSSGGDRRDIDQEAELEAFRGLRQFSRPETRPACTWSTWVQLNVPRTVQRRIDAAGTAPSSASARCARFANHHPDVKDPKVLRRLWATDQGMRASRKAAKEAGLIWSPDKALAELDVEEWIAKAPGLTAFRAGINTRSLGQTRSLNAKVGEDGTEIGDFIADASQVDADGNPLPQSLLDSSELVASLFGPIGVGKTFAEEVFENRSGGERIAIKDRSRLLREALGAKAPNTTTLHRNLMNPSTEEPWPTAVLRRNWFGFDMTPTPTEAAAFIRLGSRLWLDDFETAIVHGHSTPALLLVRWRDWALRVEIVARERPDLPESLLQQWHNFAAHKGAEGPPYGLVRPAVNIPFPESAQRRLAAEGWKKETLRRWIDWVLQTSARGENPEIIGQGLVEHHGLDDASALTALLRMNDSTRPLSRGIAWGVGMHHKALSVPAPGISLIPQGRKVVSDAREFLETVKTCPSDQPCPFDRDAVSTAASST